MAVTLLPSIRFVFRRLSLAGLALLLASCAGTPPSQQEEAAAEGAETAEIFVERDGRSLDELLARAQASSPPQSEALYLEAARLLAGMNRPDDAAAILNTLTLEAVPLPLAADIQVLKAALLLNQERPERALEILFNALPASLPMLPADRQRQIRLLRAQALEAREEWLPAAQERMYATNLLEPDEAAENHERIWNDLNALDVEQLGELAANSRTFLFQGWYELALLGRAWQYNLDRQLVELERWQRAWARHPAASALPQAMQMVQSLAAQRPASIALLLPLSTPVGQIVRDGFMTAYFDVQRIGGSVPLVRLYDTSGLSEIRPLIDRAVAEGAQMIVGPLQKSLVTQLTQEPELPVPVLALNNVEGVRPRSPNLYQFALSPENEGRQIAERAWEDGHRRVAILSPLDAPPEYERKKQSFIETWQRLGGSVVEQDAFREDYTEVIGRLLDLNDSDYRRDQLSRLLGQPLEFTQRRRQDIDFILLISPPGPARQIKPSLAYLYAGDIPVYATQDVYSGLPSPLEDRDLNGILFSDSPWLLPLDDELRQKAARLFPQTRALNLRLQAFGVDAFRLYPRLAQLQAADGGRMFGATGLLRMDEYRHIGQELYWARFNEGMAELLEQPR